tara:strand:+ start:4109 stop:4537 length:429 start_codon:yes stop_codon:yes gene_type:complete
MRVEVEHIIDETAKEIYDFEVGKIVRYVGIAFVFRDDENDVWGNEWRKHYVLDCSNELNETCFELTGEAYDEIGDYQWQRYNWVFTKIINEYNPCLLKTKHGKTRYSAQHFGGLGNKPPPKISNEIIKKHILEQMSKIEVEL